jgi:hypothetical protein
MARRRPLVIVAHADWGVDPRKRWVSVASGNVVDGWSAAASSPIPDVGDLRSGLGVTASQALFVGFDFPIGMPRRYADRAGISHFLDVLPNLGRGEWTDFFCVAVRADEISIIGHL